MANWELQLISKIVQDKNLDDVIELGVSSETFGSYEAKVCFERIVSFASDHAHFGEIISRELLLEENPTVELPKPKQSLKALCKKVRQDKLRRDLRVIHQDLDELLEDDPESALERLHTSAATLSERYVSITDVDFALNAADALKADYEDIVNNDGILGRPWPWVELTRQVGGIEDGWLVVFYGLPKTMKTWLALLVGVSLYEHCGARVLVYSREMSMKALRRRVAMILTGMPYEKYRKGMLSDVQWADMQHMMEFLQKEAQDSSTHRKIIFTKGMGRAKGELAMSILAKKMAKYKPNIVILDSAYHLSGDIDWKNITKLTQGLKVLADETGVPIVAVTQENERAALASKGSRGTSSVAQSPSWVQDADVLIRCILDAKKNKLSLTLPACREVKAEGIRIGAVPANDFMFYDYKPQGYPEWDGGESGGNYKNESVKKEQEAIRKGIIRNGRYRVDKIKRGNDK